MAISTQHLSLDVAYRAQYRYVFAKQQDNASRFVNVTMLDHGVPIIPGPGTTAKIRAEKPDGKIVYNPATIEEDDTITAELTLQMLAVQGNVRVDLALYGPNEQILSTVVFYVIVEEAPIQQPIISENQFLELLRLETIVVEAAEVASEAAAQTEASKNAAAQSATDAESAKDEAVSAKNVSVTARDEATTAKNTAVQSASAALASKNAAVSAANSASGSADYAERQAGYAKASEEAAEEYVTMASEYSSDAQTAAEAANASKVAAQAAAQQAQRMIGTFETFNFSINDWQALGVDYRPYRTYSVKTAQTTIEANTIVELVNNNPVTFARYGFAIGAVNGQNITFYSTMSESFEVNGIEVRIYG